MSIHRALFPVILAFVSSSLVSSRAEATKFKSRTPSRTNKKALPRTNKPTALVHPATLRKLVTAERVTDGFLKLVRNTLGSAGEKQIAAFLTENTNRGRAKDRPQLVQKLKRRLGAEQGAMTRAASKARGSRSYGETLQQASDRIMNSLPQFSWQNSEAAQERMWKEISGGGGGQGWNGGWVQ